MKRFYTGLILFLTVFVFTSSCVVQQNPISGNKRAYAYSWQQEIQIGQEVDQEIVSQYGLYDSDELATYVTDLGEDLLEVSHMRREDSAEMFKNTEFTFRVLDSPVVNAFALPGGYIYVTRGLMAHLNNEAQLAVVVGHEIGHVAGRHASQRALSQTIGQVAVIGGSILGQELLGLPGQSLMNLSGQAAQLLFMSYSRDHERESDRLGVEYSAMKQYVAAEGAEFFTSLRRISEKSGQSIPNMLSTHPNPGEREQTIPRLANEWREQGYEQTEYGTERYMDLLDGIVFGDNPRQGYEDDGRFVHPELEFYYPIPQQWQLVNQPSQVVLVKGEGEAVMILRIDSENTSARESVNQFTNQEGFTLQESGEAQSAGSWRAYQAEGTIDQEDNRLGVHVYAVEFQDRVYRFINYSLESDFSTHIEDFQYVTSRFDRLTDERILNIQPVRLQVVQADQRKTFRQYLPDQLPMDIEHEDIAIINQVELDTMIEPGTLLKIPVQ
jgi:predicted Zn-dependent protease